MKKLIATVTLLFLAFPVWAHQSLDKTISSLTEKTILVRAGSEHCSDFAAVSSQAGGQLELEYDNALAAVAGKELTVAKWKKLSAKNCVKDCTCFALSRVYDKYSEENKKKISKDAIEKKLTAMTDKDYGSCLKKQKNFCTRTSVKEFIKSIPAPQE